MDPPKHWPASLAHLAGDLRRIIDGRHHDPHAVLGRVATASGSTFVAYLPMIESVTAAGLPLERIPDTDLFHAPHGVPASFPAHPLLEWTAAGGARGSRIDPFGFAPSVSADDLRLFGSGGHAEAWRLLGAHAAVFDGIAGIRFAVWAPNAERVSIVGPFCDWDGRRLPLRVLGGSGVWETFVPGLPMGTLYKFEIRSRTGELLLKSDPYARAMERRPSTASIAWPADDHAWGDNDWMAARARRDWLHAPMSIYEVHLGSWQRHPDGSFLSYAELADSLVPYLREQGFTHVELLPVTEHPLDDSWGYQVSGYFAPTSRFGPPDGLKAFIDRCHQAGIGVLLDWVPAHFPRDAHFLARFDGTPCYEYADPRKGEHLDWGTYIFDYDRHEVRSFLLSSACYWLEEFHFDGLRVDAVASMIYLDFGRRDFVPNHHGGNQNLEAIAFLRQLNTVAHSRAPGAIVIAEESTEWPQVSRPVESGGLGFSMKWNMGWMHDTLAYFGEDPLYRRHHHNRLTFGMMYAYSENFVLPLSHDEVVHLKRSLLGRMPGDEWQRHANLRLLYAWQWTMPGKKLLFMGGEIGHPWEWDFRVALPWFLLEHAPHRGLQRLVADLNRLYVAEPALHRHEFEPQGFAWLEPDDAQHSTLAFLRRAGDRVAAVALNCTPVPRPGYRIGVPHGGRWRIALNTDSAHYGGGNVGPEVVAADALPPQREPFSLCLDLPPLAALVLLPEDLPALQ